MCALGRRLPSGEFEPDPNEPPYTQDEILEAMRWRRTWPKRYRDGREDQCPHKTPCASVAVCLEEMAWYFRYRSQLHEALGWTFERMDES